MSLTTVQLRPGRSAHRWLAHRIASAQSDDPLSPVTVVAPSQHAALHLRRSLSRTSLVNVRFIVLARLAEMLGAGRLAARGLTPLTTTARAALMRQAVRRDAPALVEAARHLSLVERLAALALERRRRPEVVPPDANSPTAVGALAACDAYSSLLEEHGLYDEIDLLRAATESVACGEGAPVLRDAGTILVHPLARLDQVEAGLLLALAEHVSVVVAVARLDDAAADQLGAAQLRALGAVAEAASEGGTEGPPPAAGVLVAADAGEEVRSGVRRLLADLEGEGGLALHRCAILYRDAATYGPLVRDTLRAAGLPHAALDGRPLSESIAGRGLLGLIRLREHDFARAQVLAWLSGMPRPRHHRLSPVVWDRLSREAGVVRGAVQWQERLRRLAARHRDTADRFERQADLDEAVVAGRRRRAAQADEMADRVAELDARTAPPDPASWPDLVAWAQDLRDRFLPAEPDWPQDELEAGQLVDQVLQALAAAGRVEPQVSLETFVAALDSALGSRHRPEGRLGDGVIVGPVDRAAGLALDRVHLVGMTDRSFPTAAAPDPFFGGADPLRHQAERLGEERRAYLTAVAAADGGEVWLSFPQADPDGRPLYPSPWVVDVVSELSGEIITPTRLREAPPPHPRIVPVLGMVERALPAAPAVLSLAERRTQEVVAWHQLHGRAGDSPLARRPRSPLAPVLRTLRSRRSGQLTAFDGNLAAAASGSPRLAGGLAAGAISASVIEGWSRCPFSHLMSRVLRVEETERPELRDDLSMNPADRGQLVHRILERFYSRLREQGRPGAAEVSTAADHSLMDRIADAEFEEVVARGIVGNRLIWENESATIRCDLHTLMDRDDDRRREAALEPRYFEQTFGFEGDSWTAPVIRLADGREVSLHGYIDRVDLDRAGRRALVIDYKTGKPPDRPGPSVENGLDAGRSVQLAVYAEAVRRWAADRGESVDSVTGMYWYASTRGEFKTPGLECGPPVRAALRHVVEIIDTGIRAGAFPQRSGAYNEFFGSWDSCGFCAYDRICPSGRDVVCERKAGDPASSLHLRLGEPVPS